MTGRQVRIAVGALLLALTGVPRASVAATCAHASVGGEGGSTVGEAEKHFRRGIELYDDADMVGALAEFERAYQLVASYKILYNLGQVSYQRQDYVQARAHFERYLLDGGSEIPRGRREKVEEDLRQLERRIGSIEIATEPTDDGADILVDDVKTTTAPVSTPLPANVGQRKLELVRPSGQRSVRMVEVIGGETAHIRFAHPVPGLSPIPLAAAPDVTATSARAAELLSPPESGGVVAHESIHSIAPSVWVSWSATAVLAAGSAISGGMALAASRDLQQRRDDYPLSAGDLDAPSSRARKLALVTDAFLAGTLLMAAASLYFTLDPLGPDAQADGHPPRPSHWVSQ